eukprot:11127869-Heterocapsa_arctica.AAC.1
MHSVNHTPAAAQRSVRSRCYSRSSRGSRCPPATARVQWHVAPLVLTLAGSRPSQEVSRSVPLRAGGQGFCRHA